MAPKRVGLLGIFHETNTFSHIKADYRAFDGTSDEAPGGKITRGQEILDECAHHSIQRNSPQP